MNTWRKILHSPAGKGMAATLILSLLTDMMMPTITLALTGGPSQPEFQGFTEIGVTEMVDPFTGDFSYEIPLMTVPGPNGGYPINLTYASGVGMEDEASWVGLGWSLNPGAINRNMRGVPDDFSGPQEENSEQLVTTAESDRITKSYFTKNNVTVGIGFGLNIELPEVGGADLSFASVSPNVNIYYNTYKGLGVRSGIGMKLSTLNQEGSSGGLSAGLNLNFDSNDGASAQPSISFTAKGNRNTTSVSIGFGYNSRQGITNTFLNTSISNKMSYDGDNKKGVKSQTVGKAGKQRLGSDMQSTGNGISFAAASGVPSTSMAMAGFNTGFNLDFEGGALQTTLDIPISFNGMLSVQKVKDWMANGYAYPAYGTLYSGYRDNGAIENGRALMDYNREKDNAINVKLPTLPMPVMTHDIYTVTGANIGGSFRAFRNDAGIFYEPRVASDFLGVTIGMEVAASTGFKVGVDPTVNFSHSYSGKWKVDEDYEQLSASNFFRKNNEFGGDLRTVQPFDFRFTGEMTAHTAGDSRFATLGGNGAAHYSLFPAETEFPNLSEIEYEDPDAMDQMANFFPFEDLGKFKPKASSQLNNIYISSDKTVRKFEERKVQLVEYRTKGEIQMETGITTHLTDVFVDNPTDILPGPGGKSDFDLNQSAIKKHHISEFTIVQPGGMRYVYGLPLYNRVHEERYFAIQPGTPSNAKVTTIPGLTTARKGFHGDKFFNYTAIGPYAHSHLITQIVSPDYVDVDGNGPSDDDFGYWTRFNYQAIGNYKWRTPVEANKGNYIEGYPSSKNDDKATVTYGERDVTYLHSIETKTHVAVFYVSNRSDARGATGLNGGAAGAYSQKLDRILLYSKGDLGKPIKSVHFEYNYELCNGVKNGSSGKLTLKKVYFKYADSPKGALTPYQFEYGQVYKDETGANANGLVEDTGLNGNPGYSMMQIDRWGNYKEEEYGLSNTDNPYVNQSADGADKRQESATAWNLTTMILPTGAKVKISYELDDYAYVQDKPANQVYRIAGTSNGSSDEMIYGVTGHASITDDFRKVYFYLDDPANTTSADVQKMVAQIPDAKIFFKTWQRLQIPKGIANTQWAYDYVTGYAPIEPSQSGVQDVDGTNYGYVTLKEDVTGPTKNFFRKAGIQYLRYQRADLDMPQDQADAALEAAAMILTVVPIITQASQMLKGYYRWALGRNYCKEIGSESPSFIRLGIADGVKYGGGHRVRKITISDAWDDLAGENAATYGLQYLYTTKDADRNVISSGVASYEPLIGGEENPLKKAHYYDPDSKFSYNDPAFFVEEPFGESYFPAPVVGYSKTTIVNLANKKTTKTGDGIQVKEFYTAKDFPIKASFTPQPQRVEDKQNVYIPLIATITLKGYGYSQGFYVELNDMHGKPRTETLYDADYWDAEHDDWKIADAPYVSTKIYNYKASGKNLVNNVDVLDADQQVRSTVMGETSEMFSEMKEDFSYSIGAGGQINGGVDPLPAGIFVTAFPNFEYSESSARTLVTTKVVYKNGILDEVLEMSEGSVKRTRNLLFDAENGAPLLTVVTTDYDNPESRSNDQYIYNYTYPAHWNYSGMQAAYRNYRNYYDIPNPASTSFPEAANYLELGDELLSSTGERVWVKQITASGVVFMKADGSAGPTSGKFVTIKSGKRNLQEVPSGSITSLSNPIGAYYNPLLDYYNSTVFDHSAFDHNLTTGQSDEKEYPTEGIPDCAIQDMTYTGSIHISRTNTQPYPFPGIYFDYKEQDDDQHPCLFLIRMPDALLELGFNPAKIKLGYYSKTQVLVTYYNTPTDIRKYPVNITGRCIPLNYCLKGVLNAAADEFSDKWSYNGDFTAPSGLNDYLKGRSGIWRKLRTNAYFVERKQRTTQPTDTDPNAPGHSYIGRDGTYERFCTFDWKYSPGDGVLHGNKDNAQARLGWRWQAEVTSYGYSPYGYEIENRDALNIYSAELYGYNNSLVTATARNAEYPEIAYDGFEEVPAGTYAQRGHMNLTTLSTNATISISNEQHHTGRNSLKLETPSGGGSVYMTTFPAYDSEALPTTGGWQMYGAQRYLISFWYKFGTTHDHVLCYVKEDENLYRYINVKEAFNSQSQAIEGWRRFEMLIDLNKPSAVPPNPIPPVIYPNRISVSIEGPQNSVLYIDDIRIHPADAPFKSFAYDRQNYILRAALDENNYATFYNYDEENNLTQVKKETERGVMTIQTTRKNIKQPSGN